MLDIMRKNAQSWLVKIVFALIVIVFVFWGVGSFRADRHNIVAKVNGNPILLKDFARAYERQVEAIRRSNPEVTAEDLAKAQFKKKLFDQMVNAQLLSEAAEKWGIGLSPAELRLAVASIPAFQNEAKQFDPERYKALLQQNGLTPAQFESDLSHNILMERMQNYVQIPGRVGEEDAKLFFDFAQQQVTMDYLSFPISAYESAVNLTDAQIDTAYKERAAQFSIPARIKLSFVHFTPAALAAIQNVSPTEIEDFYAKHKTNFTSSESVKARHILIKLDKDAPKAEADKALKKIQSIKAELAKGQKFETLAAKYSEDQAAKGGDLGWFGRGKMVEAFEKTAFAMNKGEISQPVRSPFGYHLIKVEDKRTEGLQPLAAVKEEIQQRIAEEKAAEKATELMDNVLEQALAGKPLVEAAQKVGLTTQESAFFSRTEGLPGLPPLPKELLDSLFAMDKGKSMTSPVLIGDGYLLAQVLDKQPEGVEPLTAVKGKIVALLKTEGAKKTAKSEADKILSLVTSAKDTPKDLVSRIKTTEPFGRGGEIPGLGKNGELSRALFRSKPDAWLDKSFETQTGFVVARLKSRIQADEDAWSTQKSFWASIISNARQQELAEAFIQSLHDRAKIEIINPDYLQ